ncbi:MAG: hypothetical protein IT170_13910 [Bryobacterales bacterium]|nr:hypothetical protein [Bryobacterales bacterium]
MGECQTLQFLWRQAIGGEERGLGKYSAKGDRARFLAQQTRLVAHGEKMLHRRQFGKRVEPT